MSKKEFKQMWMRKSLREMLSAIKERVGKLEEYMEDVKEDSVQELLDSQMKKLKERNDALEAMVKALKEETMAMTMALSTRIEELKSKLALCRVAVGKGVSSATLSNVDVPKLKEFVGTRSHAMWTISCGGWKITSAGPQIKGKVRLRCGKSFNAS
ncbi:hypothetical protein Godav_010361 [Gossypium davidsonii]|uniref:Uncharacterized protein n=2 Tax=Gossypium TaxID=3633 RepID=A0A7J8SI00_GOSDV|nr:hypothetical protein [Gossypium davidsonii]MBA0660663.1 hypothetical protein [Gossypium klotzschianum]